MLSFSVVVVLVLVTLTSAQHVVPQEWLRKEYPNPMEDVNECGRSGQKSAVCDPNHLLTYDEANQLDKLIEKVENTTLCPCSQFACTSDPHRKGYRIAVALMLKMSDAEARNAAKHGEDMEEAMMIGNNLELARLFAYTLMDRYKLGKCREGLIILFSLKDNVLYTMTDNVTGEKLHPRAVGDIAMSSRAKFGDKRANPSVNIFEGLEEVINDYKRVFDGNYVYKVNGKHSKPKTGAVVSRDSGARHLVASLLTMLVCFMLASL